MLRTVFILFDPSGFCFGGLPAIEVTVREEVTNVEEMALLELIAT